MRDITNNSKRLPALLLMALAASAWQGRALAQAAAGPSDQESTGGQNAQQQDQQSDDGANQLEEVVVVGRFLSASEELVNERLQDSSVVDTLGADAMGRLGDSTIGAALRRVPGLSLVSDKYVYIRGLGERYSATSLNGMTVPSPDLTRNVIPLDVFPTSVVESVRVQKAWSPDLSANFGGGSVDIRTKGVPDAFDLGFEFGTGANSAASGKAYTYPGGGNDKWGTDDGTRALSPDIVSAINTYQGDVSVQSILSTLQASDPTATLADAQQINRSMGVALNRNIPLEEKNIPPDLGLKANVGNRFYLSDNWEAGFQLGATYENYWRKTTREARNFVFPDERTDTEKRSTNSVNLSGIANFGLNFTDDHEISTTSLYLRNTDDSASVRDFFNENRQISDGRGFRDYLFKFEARDMRTNQIRGTHYFGDDTRERFPGLAKLFSWVPRDANLQWHYSESTANTDIPNQVGVHSYTVTDPLTAEVLSEAVEVQSTAAGFRFTDLSDKVMDYGWDLTWPLQFGRSMVELKGGGGHSQKARTYRQSEFSLGPLSVADLGILSGSLDQVFSDSNLLDPANNFVFARQGTNNQSYIAATMTDAFYGIVDWTYNDLYRLTAGARWESYRQAAVDWNPYGFSEAQPQVTTDVDTLQKGIFSSDKYYPSVAFTYMPDWLADTFQLRFGWSETTVRPDLREVTDASYLDPITQILTRGNSGVVPADVTNYDIRAEWYMTSGDNLSVTLFDKEIDNPIEFFESPASDTNIAREIVNAESARVRGVEFEGLKKLGFLGNWADPFFVQGNVTIQDSRLVAGPRADTPTNPVRSLAGASDYVVNMMLGFDSPDGKHTASFIYNVFGKRLYVAGRNGAPDGFEQPFHSLDLTYSWYPTDTLTFKAKAQNILGDKVEITRNDVRTFRQDPGTTMALSLSWAL